MYDRIISAGNTLLCVEFFLSGRCLFLLTKRTGPRSATSANEQKPGKKDEKKNTPKYKMLLMSNTSETVDTCNLRLSPLFKVGRTQVSWKHILLCFCLLLRKVAPMLKRTKPVGAL